MKPAQKEALHSTPGRIAPEEASKVTRRITTYSVIVGILLIILKFLTWQETDSAGVLSSLVHSSVDLLAAFSTYFGVRFAARKPDKSHSFGLGKAESIIAVIQASVVIFAALHVFEHGVERLGHSHGVHDGADGLIGMAIATLLTCGLLFAQNRAIAATGSVAIKGDRAHFMADMAANIAVIIGLVLSTYTSFALADALTALLISAWLAFTAFLVLKIAYNQLMDKELPDTEREYIRALAGNDSSIMRIRNLRTRASGPHLHIQMHAVLDESLSLLNAHKIIAGAQARIIDAFPAADVTIHPEPAGHEHGNILFQRND